MFKFLKRNQKQALAVLCVVSMIFFIKGLVPSGNANGMRDLVAGTLNGTEIKQSQMAAMMAEWQLLNVLRYQDPNRPDQTGTLLSRYLGPYAVPEISKNAGTFFLLVQEANQHNFVATEEEVESVLKNNVANMPTTIDDDRAHQAISDMLIVRDLLGQATDCIKISRPVANQALARDGEKVSVNLVIFRAAQFLPALAAPPQDKIQIQYDTFKDDLPGQFGSMRNPLGFGYKIDNRYKIQSIGITHDAVRDAAIKSKSMQDWYVAAYGEFKSNRETYDAEPVPAANVASTQTSTTMPASQPTARKLDDLNDDFRLHAQVVLDALYDQETAKLEQQIVRKMNDAISTGFGVYHDAQIGEGAATQTEVAAAYTNFNFFTDLAQSIQSQYGVLPVTVNVDQFKLGSELDGVPGVGHSFYVTATANGTNAVPFADLPKTMTRWRPSELMRDVGRNFYFFRISDIDPAHTLPMDEVKDRVVSDWKTAAGYDQALSAAHALATEAQERGLRDAAAPAGNLFLTTQAFAPRAIYEGRPESATISPLNIHPESARELARASQNLINMPAGKLGRPVDVAQLYPDAIAAVIELNSAMPQWTPEENGLALGVFSERLRETEMGKLLPDFCNYEKVAQRLNFKPDPSLKLSAQ
ncbi:MAG: hypothetical protein M3O30_10205 [Planctomycetota bacterium]|nr:hypothetical protein [Planctomycetota bacterium]